MIGLLLLSRRLFFFLGSVTAGMRQVRLSRPTRRSSLVRVEPHGIGNNVPNAPVAPWPWGPQLAHTNLSAHSQYLGPRAQTASPVHPVLVPNWGLAVRHLEGGCWPDAKSPQRRRGADPSCHHGSWTALSQHGPRLSFMWLGRRLSCQPCWPKEIRVDIGRFITSPPSSSCLDRYSISPRAAFEATSGASFFILSSSWFQTLDPRPSQHQVTLASAFQGSSPSFVPSRPFPFHPSTPQYTQPVLVGPSRSRHSEAVTNAPIRSYTSLAPS